MLKAIGQQLEYSLEVAKTIGNSQISLTSIRTSAILRTALAAERPMASVFAFMFTAVHFALTGSSQIGGPTNKWKRALSIIADFTRCRLSDTYFEVASAKTKKSSKSKSGAVSLSAAYGNDEAVEVLHDLTLVSLTNF